MSFAINLSQPSLCTLLRIIKSSKLKTVSNEYDSTIEGRSVSFEYNSITGIFGCGIGADCRLLTQ